MEYIFTDASFSHQTKIGGAAVVVPKWLANHKGKWLSRLKVRIFHDKDKVIFCAACKCSDSHDAEKRALGIAFLAAHDMLKAKSGIKIEIITDSLSAINDIITNEKEDLITSAISNLRRKENIIVSKTKAHNGHEGNELADKWAKRTRRKFEEDNNMRMPFRNNNSYGNNNRQNNSRPNPFDGSTEMDIRTLTERVLNDENNIGFVTPEGKVMPRNMAFGSGNRNGIELVKQRIWGNDEDFPDDGESDAEYYPVNIVYSDEALQMIAAESSKSPDSETGGALIGSWQRDPDGYITVNVERATGPGSDAVRNHALFSPHMDYYRARIAYYRETHNWDYLGEWHKHPGNFDSLSNTDIDTAHELIDGEGWPLLLLPIVNEINGRFVMENNLILSHQLGNEIMTHIGTVELDDSDDEGEITAYLDGEAVNTFRAGNEDVEILDGIYNPGESFVFIDIPGVKNAVAKLIRDNGKNLPVSGVERVLTVFVGDDDIRCYFSDEGEIKSAGHVIIDKNSTIYERNAGLTETTILREKTVTLIGCGSLGSTMAVSLARAGVENFHLFDPDKLSPVNIARHQAGLKDLGRLKVNVIRDIIHGINPAISVEIFPFDIVNSSEGYEAFTSSAINSDIIICTTDTDDSRMLANDFAVKNKIKAVQAGLHERAKSGIVHVYEPDSDEACFACFHDTILSETSKRNENIAYSEANNVRELTIQPGLSAQINIVAEIAALRVIESLMDRKSLPALTLVYIDNADDDSERSLALNIRHLEMNRLESCKVCGNDIAIQETEAAND